MDRWVGDLCDGARQFYGVRPRNITALDACTKRYRDHVEAGMISKYTMVRRERMLRDATAYSVVL